MNQAQRIHTYLLTGRSLTRLQSWDLLGVLECPARISELRKDGVEINTEMVSVKNKYGESVRVAKWTIDQVAA